MSNPTETIQFLPESRRRLEISHPGEYKLLYWALGFLVICALIYGGIWFYSYQLEQKIIEQDAAISAKNAQRDQKFEKSLLALNQRLTLVNNMLDQHPVWSLVLNRIQATTPATVQFVSLSGDTKKAEVIFKAIAVDYASIAKQIANYLADPLVKDIAMGKATPNSTGLIEYNMTITFNPDKILLANFKPKQ